MKITKNLIITKENQNDYKKLTECNYLRIESGAKLDAPVLTTTGYIDLSENAKLDAPVLTTTGYIDLRENAKILCKLTNNLKYRSIDHKMFVVEAKKTTKGIKIYSGYNLNNIENKKLIKENAYVAGKDGFFAHGETIKKAISDVQFKIMAEKLKSEPIKEDTIITVKHYRLITGACQVGVDSWMKQVFNEKEQAKILDKGIKAKELLPILTKHNAYGIDRFKSLITFITG